MNDLNLMQVSVFRTALGWFAMGGRDLSLCVLTFGHHDADDAQQTIEKMLSRRVRRSTWNRDLRQRLQDYADGAPMDFLDIPLEAVGLTRFSQAVIEACRRIPYGQTFSYGQLAQQAGALGAARAVGNVMRSNRCPLVVPCHRVVHGDGRLGNFSAPQGVAMKQRLLNLERATLLTSARPTLVEH